MRKSAMIEALQRVEQGQPIHPNTSTALLRQNLIRADATGGFYLLDAAYNLIGGKFVIQQYKKLPDGGLWVTIGSPFADLESAEAAARLRSVADEVDYRVVRDDSNPATFVLYAFGSRYIQNADGLRTQEINIVPPSDTDEPMYLFAVERNQGTGWQRVGERLYTSKEDAEEAAAIVSKAKPGDYRVVPDDTPALPPAMWRAGRRCPNIHLLREMVEIGGGADLIPPLVQLWTGESH